MKKLFEFDIKNPIIVFISMLSLFMFLIVFFFSYEFTWPWLIFFILLRFPHEIFHYIGGKLVGVDSTINFWRLNATCTPTKAISSYQNKVFSLLPYVSFLIIGIVLFVFSIIYSNPNLYKIAHLLVMYQTYASMGDLFFCSLSFIFPSAVFKDNGTSIIVYEM